MVVSDDALAQAYLNKIGYYRLSGYWYPYRKSKRVGPSTIVEDQFRDQTKFSEIVDLYVFDKKLRLLMLDVIERIEIALRVQITLQLGKHGSLAHRDRAALHPNFSIRPSPKSGEIEHEKWLRRHDEAFQRSREEFAKHFKTKYAGEQPPIWIAAELWDFGAMSFLFSGMKKADQLEVARTFGVGSWEVMTSWLHHINVARNICAHHSRFWNKPNTARPVWPSAADCPDLGHIEFNTTAKTRVYGLACLSAHLLRSINPNSEWPKRFKEVIGQFPKSKVVSLKAAGFPDDWEKANLWA
ncbi:Abi family protein [Bradyrhizobium yuanmingense]|uniref:Abi family protein n=1 Tax=Bradyrhizobium yuanmingense TaxID=108015 RepID=UPI0012FAC69F|nr:Abi family protein [Bradyrhizobium yuanmingense]